MSISQNLPGMDLLTSLAQPDKVNPAVQSDFESMGQVGRFSYRVGMEYRSGKGGDLNPIRYP